MKDQIVEKEEELKNLRQQLQKFEQARKISERTGDAKLIAKAYNNLGVLAMSRGNFDMAQEHFERALAKFQAIGNIDLAAAVKANLALCALEEGDSLGAVTTAEEALAMLRSSDTARWRGQVLAIIDLRKFFGVEVRGLSDLSRVLVVGAERSEFGVLADRGPAVRH